MVLVSDDLMHLLQLAEYFGWSLAAADLNGDG